MVMANKGSQLGDYERTITAAKAYAEAIVDTVRESLVVLADDLSVVSANRSFYETFKVSPEETEGHRLDTLGNGQWNIPSLKKVFEDIRAGRKELRDFEVEHDFPEIGTKLMLLNARQLQLEGQSLILLAIEDLTQAKETERARNRIEAELRRSNEELEQFAYVASHDLQEPLRMVSSYTQLLARRYQGKLDEDADEFIGYAVDGARRMQQLINDLLDYSRIGTRGRELTPASSQSAFDRALQMLSQALAEVEVDIDCDPLPSVMGDERQLVQLFQNLLSNAIKFRGSEPLRIRVRAQDAGDMWRFTVEDNGIGIDPQYAERIFVVFQRLHGKEHYGGTGIGLAICKKIVERHSGRIWLEPSPSPGATFAWTLLKGDDA